MTIKHISYNDYEKILNNDKENIINYATDNNIKFDYLISISKENHIMNSMLAMELNCDSIFLNTNDNEINFKDSHLIFNSSHLNNKTSLPINILLVQSIFDMESYHSLQDFIKNKKLNLYLYASVSRSEVTHPSNIFIGNIYHNDIQFPWDKAQFTPLNELEKLNGLTRIEINSHNRYFLGFSSSDLLNEVKVQIPPVKEIDSISFQDKDYHNEVVKKDNFYQMHLIEEYELLNKNILSEKINFIQKSGLTHYIESNFQQALILSKYIKITSILYYEEKSLYQVNLEKFSL